MVVDEKKPAVLAIAYWAIEKLIPYIRNARTHSPEQVAQVAASIREFGWTNPILVDDKGSVIAGHARLLAARQLEMEEVPVIVLDHLTEAQRRALILADNKLALNAGWDPDMLRVELLSLDELNFDLELTGFSDEEIKAFLEPDPSEEIKHHVLADDFIVPPFSVLNAREGSWQERKANWIALGIESEVGRGENLLEYSDVCNSGGYKAAKKHTASLKTGLTYNLTMQPYSGETGTGAALSGTSIFDPVLCELAYYWFSPDGGQVVDPFAGGSVRGIVAHKLNRRYWGCDLRQEQIDANDRQGKKICGDDAPDWVCGDAMGVLGSAPDADFVFSCPPYGDLERYSDDPHDLSTMEYHTFIAAYKRIIARACERLKNHRFACFVVGDFRDTKTGNYRNFVSDTISAFRQCGLELYNEAILVTAVGSLALRVTKQFTNSRKLGKTHQNVLVFVKGDGKQATAACGVLHRVYDGAIDGASEETA